MTPRLPGGAVAGDADEVSGEVTSTFQRRPCYRYVRKTDRTGAGTWWLAAFDPDSGIAWGVAEIVEREVGSFDMDELVAFRGLMGLPIELDLFYRPQTITALLEGGR